MKHKDTLRNKENIYKTRKEETRKKSLENDINCDREKAKIDLNCDVQEQRV